MNPLPYHVAAATPRRMLHAELDPAEWWGVVRPLPSEVTAPLSAWLDAQLRGLEETFRAFSTPASYVSSLGHRMG
jgi:hypothetical protein